MNRPFRVLILFSLLMLLPSARSQSTQDDILIARLKANRTQYKKYDQQGSLRTRAQTENHDIAYDLIVLGRRSMPEVNSIDGFASSQIVSDSAGGSDIILVGTVTKNISALTQSGGFVFTDSEFVIDEVLGAQTKSADRPAQAAGDEVTITSPGGQLYADGHKISASVSDSPQLRPGRTYLLFLRYIPASQSYSRVGIGGFDISGGLAVPLRTDPDITPAPIPGGRDQFIAAMRAALVAASPGGAR